MPAMSGEERSVAMTHKTIKVSPTSELSLSLKAAQSSGEPVVVDTGAGVYTLFVAPAESLSEDVFAGYDPQAAIAGLRALDDALSGVDRERLLRDLREQRAQGSSGRTA
jgi:hypothetical protein